MNEGPSAVGQGKGGTLGGDGFLSNEEPMGGCVVLCLLSGSKAIGADPLWDIFLEVGLTHQAGKAAVGNVEAVIVF